MGVVHYYTNAQKTHRTKTHTDLKILVSPFSHADYKIFDSPQPQSKINWHRYGTMPLTHGAYGDELFDSNETKLLVT